MNYPHEKKYTLVIDLIYYSFISLNLVIIDHIDQ